jgi:hypothetical protein
MRLTGLRLVFRHRQWRNCTFFKTSAVAYSETYFNNFFTFIKNVRVPDKGVWRAGPGPRAIAWRGLPRLVAYTGDSMFEAAYPKFLMIFSELPGEHLGSICKQGMIVSFQILVT